jgi:hypothetical protein
VSAAATTAEAPASIVAAFRRALAAARASPSFALYLVALLLFPFKWLSPFSYQQAGWIDVAIAASALTWTWERLRAGVRPRLRVPHYFGAAYVVFTCISAAAVTPESRGTAWRTVVIVLELAAFAVISSDFARAPERRSAIVLAILAVTFIVGIELVVGLSLFYSGASSSLLDGWLTLPSSAYERVSAGFYSAPLLGSFCVFGSALLAREDAGIPAVWRRAGQIVLAVAVLFTFSRAIIAFALAAVLRAAHRRGSRAARAVAVVAAVAAVVAISALTVSRFHVEPAHPGATTATAPFTTAGNDRLQFITTSFTSLVHHPLLGTGPGSYPGHVDGTPARAHFTPLGVAATLGLPALLSLIGLIWSLWHWRRRPTDITIWSGMAGLGLDGIGQDIDHFRHVWMMVGFADADRRRE